MGAGVSIPATLTHEKLYELTRDTRALMNILLEYMLKEVTVRDFLALSNPDQCKKYVVFMANNLYKFFYELQIVPTKDKKGVIAFRLAKDLAAPPEPAVEQEKQSLCLVLAYYYARIFQIYGALALTLIDDVTYMVDSGFLRMFDEKDRTRGLMAPGYRPYTAYGGFSYTTKLGNFKFLKTYLTDERKELVGFKTMYPKFPDKDDRAADIYFSKESGERDEYIRPLNREITVQIGKFSILVKGSTRYAYLNLTASKESSIADTIVVRFGKLQYKKRTEGDFTSVDLSSEYIPDKKLIIDIDIVDGSESYKIKDREDTTIKEYFNEILKRLVPKIKELTEVDVVSGPTKPTTSEEGVSPELKLGRTIHNLTIEKPLGHCIARALQLLRNVPLKGEPALSYICKARFLETTQTDASGVKRPISRSGLPLPGDSLSKSPGMAALAQLFYDTIKIGSPKLEIGTKAGPDGKSSLEQYTDFMKKMAQLYGDPKTDEAIRQSGFDGIKNLRDRKICGDKLDKSIEISNDVAKRVYTYVNQLYKIQLDHAGKCGAIFKMLFNIQRDKSSGRFRISLSDTIIKKGFPEIERVNSLARKLLIDYYSNCENTYLQGADVILKAERAKVPAAPVVPAGRVTATTQQGLRAPGT